MSIEPEKPQMPWENTDPDAPWVPASAFTASAELELQMHPGEKAEDTCRRLFRENSPRATMAIIHLAMHGSTERVRFDASRYVVERVLGRVGEDAFDDEKSPITGFIDDVMEYVATAGENDGS